MSADDIHYMLSLGALAAVPACVRIAVARKWSRRRPAYLLAAGATGTMLALFVATDQLLVSRIFAGLAFLIWIGLAWWADDDDDDPDHRATWRSRLRHSQS